MYDFLKHIGMWFHAHNLMSVSAGHWCAWTVLVLIPALIIAGWILMIESYRKVYDKDPSRTNRQMMFIAYTAPVSVPLILTACSWKWCGRRLGFL